VRIRLRLLLVLAIFVAVIAPTVLAARASTATPPAGDGTGAGYCTGYAGGVASPYSFDGVYACEGSTVGATTFDNPGATYAWQCTELSARFLWAVYGIWAGPGTGVSTGAGLVNVVHGRNPTVAVGVPGPGNVPAAGDVISLGPYGGTGSQNSDGHTAVVVSGNPATGQFEIMSENDPVGGAGEQSLMVDLGGGHNGRVDYHGTWTTASWLELASSGTGPIPDGSFVQVAGSAGIYRIAGGAPLYVSNWSAVGGPQPYTVISQARFDSLNAYPTDGTFLRDQAGSIWRVAGGDPLYVNTCAPADLHGCSGLIQIDGAVVANAGQGAPWNHLAGSIADGTFVRVADGLRFGLIGRAAGGALLPLSSCAPAELSGCGGVVNVPEYTYDSYTAAHPRIADGTFVRVADGAHDGLIGRAVGGTLLPLASCAPADLDGCNGTVNVNEYSYDTYAAAHPTITSGAFVRIADGPRYGLIARVAGGALLPLSSCAPAGIDGCPGTVNVNAYSYDTYAAAHPTIAAGAYIRVADGSQDGLIARAVGGALLPLTTCAPPKLAGCAAAVNVNQYTFSTYRAAHPHPVNGAVIEKLPSAKYWRFENGVCIAASASTLAVAVNDASVSCVGKPAVKTAALPAGKVKSAYTRVLAASGGASPYTWSVSSGRLPDGLRLSPKGVLSGTPARAGIWTFTVKVADKAGQAATRKLTLVIGK
jgi:hypothetical protein